MKSNLKGLALAASALALSASVAQADQVFLDDVIVDGSLCVGVDCVNGESFGFDTIRLKENNLRIKAQDTSTSASFPTVDWQITFNESSNGGANKFSVEDIDNARVPFTIRAGARSNSIYVNASGRVGFGTASPVVDLHAVNGNTPTLRLEQDGSAGFTAQTWDLAGNEANFFVRDVTNGSQLPFKIFPGADTNALVISANNNVGVGTGNSASEALHVRRTDGTAKVLIEDDNGSSATRGMLEMRAFGPVFMTLIDEENTNTWNFQNRGDTGGKEFRITNASSAFTGAGEFRIQEDGDVIIGGTLTTSGTTCGGGCDAVFDADYDLPTIEEQYEMMYANRHLPAVGPTVENEPFNITVKVGGMLNELEKAHIFIGQLNQQLQAQDEEVEMLRSQLSEMEALKQRLEILEQERG